MPLAHRSRLVVRSPLTPRGAIAASNRSSPLVAVRSARRQQQSLCPQSGDGNATAPLDRNSTDVFDSHYFENLVNQKGLLLSDQRLFSSDEGAAATRNLVVAYSNSTAAFFRDFVNSMVKMGNICRGDSQELQSCELA